MTVFPALGLAVEPADGGAAPKVGAPGDAEPTVAAAGDREPAGAAADGAAPSVAAASSPATGSATRLLAEAAAGSVIGTGLSAGIGLGLAGWSNSLVPGLAPTVLVGAFGPGLGAHYGLRLAADRQGWRMNHRGWAMAAAGGSSALLFGALVASGAKAKSAGGMSAYLLGGSLLPIAAQWWALEPRR